MNWLTQRDNALNPFSTCNVTSLANLAVRLNRVSDVSRLLPKAGQIEDALSLYMQSDLFLSHPAVKEYYNQNSWAYNHDVRTLWFMLHQAAMNLGLVTNRFRTFENILTKVDFSKSDESYFLSFKPKYWSFTKRQLVQSPGHIALVTCINEKPFLIDPYGDPRVDYRNVTTFPIPFEEVREKVSVNGKIRGWVAKHANR